jgi:hypothetical protein
MFLSPGKEFTITIRASEALMYCPKCGIEMEDVNGTLTCVPGRMPLAKLVQDYLIEHFPLHKTRPADVSLGVELTRWFCPGCGVHLRNLTCPSCGGSIRSMHHSLVERHYHEGELEALKKSTARGVQ